LRTSREISIARSKFKGAVAVYNCSPNNRHDLPRYEINDDWRFPNLKLKLTINELPFPYKAAPQRGIWRLK